MRETAVNCDDSRARSRENGNSVTFAVKTGPMGTCDTAAADVKLLLVISDRSSCERGKVTDRGREIIRAGGGCVEDI